MLLQGRVSDAHLRGEAACQSLHDKLDISGAALQAAAADHKELERQKKAVDRKLVSLHCYQIDTLVTCCTFPVLCSVI